MADKNEDKVLANAPDPTAERTLDTKAVQEEKAARTRRLSDDSDDKTGDKTGKTRRVQAEKDAAQKARDEAPEGEPVGDDPEVLAEAGLSEPDLFGSSAEGAVEAEMPPTRIVDTEAGLAVRPENEPKDATLANATKKELDRRSRQTAMTHSGKVGNAVPIVDNYVHDNPHAGGTLGGHGGPGAVGRVKAEQLQKKVGEAMLDTLQKGAQAQRGLEDEDARDAANKRAEESGTPYRVVGGGIFTENGKHDVGEKVYLEEKDAKRFNDLGRLAPWID